jgi:hypothetical protein
MPAHRLRARIDRHFRHSRTRRASRGPRRAQLCLRPGYCCESTCTFSLARFRIELDGNASTRVRLRRFGETGCRQNAEDNRRSYAHDVQVVDPDVRNYVYGLVTAVSPLALSP